MTAVPLDDFDFQQGVNSVADARLVGQGSGASSYSILVDLQPTDRSLVIVGLSGGPEISVNNVQGQTSGVDWINFLSGLSAAAPNESPITVPVYGILDSQVRVIVSSSVNFSVWIMAVPDVIIHGTPDNPTFTVPSGAFSDAVTTGSITTGTTTTVLSAPTVGTAQLVKQIQLLAGTTSFSVLNLCEVKGHTTGGFIAAGFATTGGFQLNVPLNLYVAEAIDVVNTLGASVTYSIWYETVPD